MKIITKLFLPLLLVGILMPRVAVPCTCIVDFSDIEFFWNGADAVFTGKVVNMIPVDEWRVIYVVQVFAAWKGVDQAQVRVMTERFGAACGYEFQLGQDYLIYGYEPASASPAHLYTHLCTRNGPMASRQTDLDFFGPPEIVDNVASSWGTLKAIYR